MLQEAAPGPASSTRTLGSKKNSPSWVKKEIGAFGAAKKEIGAEQKSCQKKS